MSLIGLIVALVVVGLVLYLVNSLIPMPQPIRVVVNALVCLVVILWLLESFGLVRGPYASRGCRY